jgi:hypothetical protein
MVYLSFYNVNGLAAAIQILRLAELLTLWRTTSGQSGRQQVVTPTIALDRVEEILKRSVEGQRLFDV